jgi:general secretion pathway protein D
MNQRRCEAIANRDKIKNRIRICVWGGQGLPLESAIGSISSMTPGSSMKSRAVAQPASVLIPFRWIFAGSVCWLALLVAGAFLVTAPLPVHAESASSFYKQGVSAEAKEDYDTAYTDFQKAFSLEPKDVRYRVSFYRMRTTAAMQHATKGRKLFDAGDMKGALAEYLRAAEIDPSNETVQQQIVKINQQQGSAAQPTEIPLPVIASRSEDTQTVAAPVDLKPVSTEPLTLHMSEDAKIIYQAVCKAAGVNVLFDQGYNSKRVQVDLVNVSLLEALRIVGTISNTFWRPVTSNTIFVAENTRAKRTELDEQAVQTFYLTNAWQQNDLNDVQTALRNVLPNAKVYGVASQNAIVMRGTPDELLLAQKLINNLDKARAEVVVDIAVMEVSKNWQRTLGLAWPSSASVALQSTSTSSSSSTTTTTSTTPTVYDLANLKASNLAVTISTLQANLLLSDSNTKILDNPRIRCTDQQKATMKIGQRIPIATGSYSTGTSTTVTSSLVNTQFQYIDVGINIEMTPTIHYDRDVTLKIKIEDSSENGSSTISGVTEPIIAQKTSEQVIRLREGEASVLSGMMNKSEILSWNGVPGLSSIPGLKYLFGSKDRQLQEDEVVFLVIPHVVRTQELSSANLRAIDTGAGTSVELRREQPAVQAPGAVPAATTSSSPAAAPAAGGRAAQSQLGAIHATTAEAAAPAAMAQLQAAANSSADAMAAKAPVAASASAATGASFVLSSPAGQISSGATFKIPVTLNNAVEVTAAPLQISYDAAKVSLVSVESGELLGRDGQPLALVHRDDGAGTITLNVARPPGATGVSGSGVVCILSFTAKAAGDSEVVITRPAVLNSAQQIVTAQGARATIHVK